MWEPKKIIEKDDLVIMYCTPESIQTVNAKESGTISTHFGTFSLSGMIGLSYGSRMASVNGKGFVILLQPTPEIWTRVLDHRTQILYLPDISYITMMLDLAPGKVIVESGTGSGSFTHSLARSVAPNGHVHTFEFHPIRAEKAKQEFLEHGMTQVVSIEARDVCKHGFGLIEIADAVFLDLPSPWEAIANARKTLKKDRVTKIATFSPCIEQIQRTCTALRENGFSNISMYECLQRSYEARSFDVKGVFSQQTTSVMTCKPTKEMRGHTSYLLFASHVPMIE